MIMKDSGTYEAAMLPVVLQHEHTSGQGHDLAHA